MANLVPTVLAAISFFVVAFAGGASVKWISGLSDKWMQLCNALAGGVVMGVALCHMLGDNLEGLNGWGQDINKALGGDPDESAPLGLALAGYGFFIVVGIEYLLSGGDHAHESGQSMLNQERDVELANSSADVPDDRSDRSSTSTQDVPKEGKIHLAGFTTLIGLTIHSSIEGIATGAAAGSTFGVLVFAVLLHKGFASFAVAASLQPIAKNSVTLWWLLVIFFSATSPIAMAVGAFFAESVEGPGSAFLQCLAAGTLLAVGITEMLMPALVDIGVWKKRKLVAAIFGFSAMALLAVWA